MHSGDEVAYSPVLKAVRLPGLTHSLTHARVLQKPPHHPHHPRRARTPALHPTQLPPGMHAVYVPVKNTTFPVPEPAVALAFHPGAPLIASAFESTRHGVFIYGVNGAL